MQKFYKAIKSALTKGESRTVETDITTGEKTVVQSGEIGIFGNVLREEFIPRPQLVLCGAGHVSKAVCSLAVKLDFDVTVMDDRAEFANKMRFKKARALWCAPFDVALDNINYNDNMYFAIMTCGHLNDRLCLEHIINKPSAYVGMIGSHRKNALVREEMIKNGYSEEKLDKVYAPIGEDIGAQSVEEIAVSIAAQLIRVRNARKKGAPVESDMINALASGKAKVLATVVDKKGSAPRGAGARLALMQDDKIVGTVGGGSAEYEVIKAAKKLKENAMPTIVHFNMTNAEAQKEGMICGGEITVLLERIDKNM
ncbi:MAG: XdhC/CoxI family protein [Oscillospiraceae bacterium]